MLWAEPDQNEVCPWQLYYPLGFDNILIGDNGVTLLGTEKERWPVIIGLKL